MTEHQHDPHNQDPEPSGTSARVPGAQQPVDPAGRAVDDLVAIAVAALTTAATRTRTGPHGRTYPVDFAEIACRVLTTVAANVGGIDKLLAGRPGSWEADRVRQIVYSTASEDDLRLMQFRTEPIILHLDAEDVFDDVGLDEVYQRDIVTAEAAVDVAHAGGDPEQVERAEQLLVAVEQLYEQDLAAYHAAYEQTVRAELAKHGVTAPVQLRRRPIGSPVIDEDGLAVRLHEIARTRTPLPATGQPRTLRRAPPRRP